MPRIYLQDVEFVDFYHRPIITGFSEDAGWVVPMKYIIEEHLGLDWESMRKKMNKTSTVRSDGPDGEEIDVQLFNPILVSGLSFADLPDLSTDYPDEDVPEFLPNQEYICLPAAELNLFLCQISLNHVNIDVRENLYLYQKECGRALHDYWFRGFSINDRTNPSRISSARHDHCPVEQTSKALSKVCARYSVYADRTFEDRIDPVAIQDFADQAIDNLLGSEDSAWEEAESAYVFNKAFMQRGAFDIIHFSMEANVPPSELQDVIERNLLKAWENMGTCVLAVQSPYTPFPGVGRGLTRELVRD